MRPFSRFTARLSIAVELVRFFLRHKWWWLTPIILALLLFSVVVVLTQSGAIAPFIYTLF